MLSDIEIINKSKLMPIDDILARFDFKKEEVYHYGRYIAKIELGYLARKANKQDGKLVLVTAITPTPAGEGKSTTTIGLVDSLNALGVNAVGAIREPSLGPVFGVKGGAAGGGYAQVNPMVELNLHFTGDIHAITVANNLVSAVIDNHLYQGNALDLDPQRIVWQRCLDLNDRALRKVEVGLSSARETRRFDYFNISVASDIMAILCLATSFQDLRQRLERAIVAYTKAGTAVTIADLGITGSLLVLLQTAIKPNVVQTLENNLMFVHGGPFANIAHGCNSLLATKMALKTGDFVITEAGFGSDLGAEKFLNIKTQLGGFAVSAIVVVATIRALKYHGGAEKSELKAKNLTALERGLANLAAHLEHVQKYGVPLIVALNKFDGDDATEIQLLHDWAAKRGIKLVDSEVFASGSKGGKILAQAVVESARLTKVKPLYRRQEPLKQKITTLVREVYGGRQVAFSASAAKKLAEFAETPVADYFICMAKTPASLADDPQLRGRPRDFTVTIRDIRISSGAEFVICLTGQIMTMPGLPREPLALAIDIDEDFVVKGLM